MVLSPEEHHLVGEDLVADAADRLVIELAGEVDARELGANVPGDLADR
jgi:hypothetical protein